MACLYCDAAEATALLGLGAGPLLPVFWGQGGGAERGNRGNRGKVEKSAGEKGGTWRKLGET